MTKPGGAPGPALFQSPRFGGCSARRSLAEIAAKVVGEFPPEEDNGDYEEYYYDGDVFREFEFDDLLQKNDALGEEAIMPGDQSEEEDQEDGNGEFEFEFPVPQSDENSSPISAGQIFCDGRIKPLFPAFNEDLIFDAENRLISPRPSPASSSDKEENSNSNPCSDEIVPIQIPLWKLLLSDRKASLTASASCSSSEADELEAVYPGVCTPPKEEMSKKSKSTGTSKRWKLKNLVRRSRSDGRDNFVFWIPKQRQQQPAKEKAAVEKGCDRETTSSTARKARRVNYQKNSATEEGGKKKKSSDVVRFFGNGSGVSTPL